MSAATDALREALDVDASESEMDELRSALDSARTALQDAANEVRTALANVQEVGAAIRTLFNGEDDGEVKATTTLVIPRARAPVCTIAVDACSSRAVVPATHAPVIDSLWTPSRVSRRTTGEGR
jgi:hypothetical protein